MYVGGAVIRALYLNKFCRETTGILPVRSCNGLSKFWSSGGRGCFPKGTKITTPFGLRDISELQKGDFVIAMNCKNGEKQTRKILKKLTHIKQENLAA